MIDITGKRFGRLIAVRPVEKRSKSRSIYWLCACDCGNQVIVCGSDLRDGHTESCGCLKKERGIEANFRHGESKTALYKRWTAIRQRCLNQRASDYPRYGGRGIRIAEEWNDFSVFKRWAITHGYAENLTIERIDNDGDYTPENCMWISLSQQAKNKRKTIWVNGLCLKDYCRLNGLNYERERRKIKQCVNGE